MINQWFFNASYIFYENKNLTFPMTRPNTPMIDSFFLASESAGHSRRICWRFPIWPLQPAYKLQRVVCRPLAHQFVFSILTWEYSCTDDCLAYFQGTVGRRPNRHWEWHEIRLKEMQGRQEQSIAPVFLLPLIKNLQLCHSFQTSVSGP